MGVMRMTKEHLGLAISMKMPTYVVITKVDIAPEHVLAQTLKVITRILKSNAAGRLMPSVIKTMDDVMNGASQIRNGKLVPIFLVSNVTGEGLDLLKAFLNLLPSKPEWESLVSTSFHHSGSRAPERSARCCLQRTAECLRRVSGARNRLTSRLSSRLMRSFL